MLADSAYVGNLQAQEFDSQYWQNRGEISAVTGGRGAAWFIDSGERQWVLRHYRRGGLVARVCADRYLWCGEAAVRSFAEWHLLAALVARGLPVPKPIAARYQRVGLLYRCELITQRIPNTQPLSAALNCAPQSESQWRAVGVTIARLHAAGVDHADLNAHNILLNDQGAVSVIDFDRGRLRSPGAWRAGNLRRLYRSLIKITRAMPANRFSLQAWDWFRAGYGSG